MRAVRQGAVKREGSNILRLPPYALLYKRAL